MAQAQSCLIQLAIHFGDLLFQQAQIDQMCRLESLKAMQRDIAVCCGNWPGLAEARSHWAEHSFHLGFHQVLEVSMLEDRLGYR